MLAYTLHHLCITGNASHNTDPCSVLVVTTRKMSSYLLWAQFIFSNLFSSGVETGDMEDLLYILIPSSEQLKPIHTILIFTLQRAIWI